MISTDYHEWDLCHYLLTGEKVIMSDLNHELDRDNLNKPSSASDADRPLQGLRFPSESDHYERHPSSPVTARAIQAGRAS